jgi:putative 4-mercaptohistidine N1-methyltranferase
LTRRAGRETGAPAAYESQREVDQYLLFHYGRPAEVLPHRYGPRRALGYPARCARLLLELCAEPPRRALDLGCAVGGATFELARACPEVLGVDLSRSFVAAATELRRSGALAYRRIEEGERATPLVAKVPEGVERQRAHFVVGDAAAPPAAPGSCDAVLLANLIDRVDDPACCLLAAADLVRIGGTFFVSSPYTWLPDFTPRERWLGGASDHSPPSSAVLRSLLEPAFELLTRRDLPFLLREHARKYQWSVAEATVWRRRGDGLRRRSDVLRRR